MKNKYDLLTFYGDVCTVAKLFDRMTHPSVLFYNSVVRAFTNSGFCGKTLEVYY